ncbi:MAG TPA: PKD domain-containing protein, partial [Hymenobacter sp.]
MTKYFMRLTLMLGLLLTTSVARAAAPVTQVPFVPNNGQWTKQVKFAVNLPNGQLFLENNCFTYSVVSPSAHGPEKENNRIPVAAHAFRVTMVGAAAVPALSGEERQAAFHNYFLGKDPAKWAEKVPLYAGVRYHEAYPGIDVRWHQQASSGQLEYDFELRPGAKPAAIRLRYDGLDGMAITAEGHLQLRTSVGELREQAPAAWQLSATGERRAVPCRFVLRGQEISFALGAGYDPAQRLVIDPVLVFATYSGSPIGMSANTATADAQGNMYTGGQLFGGQYPVTLGAIKTTYTVGNIGIAKFTANGSSLIYATYLGGNGSGGNLSSEDYPLDLEVNAAGELLMLGTTTASDYPTTAGAFDRQLGTGGPGGFAPPDLVVTRFNAAGTAILASTYLGGSTSEAGSVSLVPGGLAVDPATGDVLVASATQSFDYPLLNAAQTTRTGGYEGVLTRFTPGLTALRWSTYLGGSGDDRAHDVKVAANGDVYVCGGTASTNLPLGTPGVLPAAPAGNNGFVLRYSAAGLRLGGTYLGTAGADVARFLDFDASGQVLVGGASDGAYPRTAGAYGAVVPGSTGFFVHALNPALSATVFSTQVSVVAGSSLMSSNVLTGFGRDNCGRLYFSTYGGNLPSPGCPRTADAFSSQSRSLYLAVLAENATALLYGTYVGEANSSTGTSFGTHTHFAASNHVSRAGVLYHLTCNNGRTFGTTPGAFSSGATGGLDGAAFKFDMAPSASSAIQLAVSTPPAGCAPYGVQFANTTVGPLTYSWDFGDGSPLDTAKAPRHVYTASGTFTARLVATRRVAAAGCGGGPYSLAIPVVVAAPAPVRTVADSLGCGRSLTLNPASLAPNGRAYRWSTGAVTATLSVAAAGRYTVEIDEGQPCPSFIQYDIADAPGPRMRLVADSVGCGRSLVLEPLRLLPAAPGRTFRWSTGATTPTVAVTAAGRYRVEIERGAALCPMVFEYN